MNVYVNNMGPVCILTMSSQCSKCRRMMDERYANINSTVNK